MVMSALRADHDLLVNKESLVPDGPGEAKLPEPWAQPCRIYRLNALSVELQFDSAVQASGRWAVKLNVATNHAAELVRRQGDGDLLFGRMVGYHHISGQRLSAFDALKMT